MSIYLLAYALPALQAAISDIGLGLFSAAIAFGLSAIGAAIAISRAGSAGLAAAAERPELRTTAIIIAALGEAIAIYGLIIVILLIGALPH
jgi:V/A-type H+-transporting ATPase subunit K